MSIEREIAMRIEVEIDSIIEDYQEQGVSVRWVDADWYPDSGAGVMVKVEESEK